MSTYSCEHCGLDFEWPDDDPPFIATSQEGGIVVDDECADELMGNRGAARRRDTLSVLSSRRL